MMTHLEVEDLASDYLEGRLESSQRAQMEGHLTECAACRDLLGAVRHVLGLCRTAEIIEPRPWLISRIMVATLGQRQPTWRERLGSLLRPVLQPRVAYPLAMSVFTFSILVNAAGLNLRSLRLEDLNPRTWVDSADRQGHLMYARAEKFYYDLRVVYEVESRFRQLGDQPSVQEEEPSPPEAPGGGSSQSASPDASEASITGAGVLVAAQRGQEVLAGSQTAVLTGAERSVIR